MDSKSDILGTYFIANGYEHDPSITHFREGKVFGHYPLERISGVKYYSHLLDLDKQNI